jgi:gamma-glutamyl:cysteine ligase YbdK (ATP-grasp superfamily)
MTKLLEKVLKKASQLSESEQDELASVILNEIASEKRWRIAFSKSQDKLSKLADEALEEFKKGKTKPLNLDEL